MNYLLFEYILSSEHFHLVYNTELKPNCANDRVTSETLKKNINKKLLLKFLASH